MLLPLECMTKAESFKVVTGKFKDNLVSYLNLSYNNSETAFVPNSDIFFEEISFVLVEGSQMCKCTDSFSRSTNLHQELLKKNKTPALKMAGTKNLRDKISGTFVEKLQLYRHHKRNPSTKRW